MLPIFCQVFLSAKMMFSLPRHILLDTRARLTQKGSVGFVNISANIIKRGNNA